MKRTITLALVALAITAGAALAQATKYQVLHRWAGNSGNNYRYIWVDCEGVRDHYYNHSYDSFYGGYGTCLD